MPHFCGRTHARWDRRGFIDVLEPEPVAQSVPPTAEEIASLAYSYWQSRGCPAGSPWEDWFRAERDLKGKSSTSA